MLTQVQPGNANQGYLKDLENHLSTLVNKDGPVRKALLILIPSNQWQSHIRPTLWRIISLQPNYYKLQQSQVPVAVVTCHMAETTLLKLFSPLKL